MQLFYGLISLLAIGIVIFAFQNPNTPLVAVKERFLIFSSLHSGTIRRILGADKLQQFFHSEEGKGFLKIRGTYLFQRNTGFGGKEG